MFLSSKKLKTHRTGTLKHKKVARICVEQCTFGLQWASKQCFRRKIGWIFCKRYKKTTRFLALYWTKSWKHWMIMTGRKSNPWRCSSRWSKLGFFQLTIPMKHYTSLRLAPGKYVVTEQWSNWSCKTCCIVECIFTSSLIAFCRLFQVLCEFVSE